MELKVKYQYTYFIKPFLIKENKYKKCHMEFDEKLKSLKERGFEVPSHNIIKTKEQIEKIKENAISNMQEIERNLKNFSEN